MSEKILVVEDDPLMLAALEILLTDEGYDVTTASSGLEAIQMAKETSYDLVVCDVRMAEMDGIETISNLKREQPDTRSIVITGYASPDVPIRAIKMGVDDYLMKPFDDRQFVQSVKRSLENYRLQKSFSQGLEQQWRDFAAIIKLLAEGVEERDPHFSGHSRRVADLALRIGKALGLGRNRLEVLELAAYLHDVGNIGQKKAFLDKTEEMLNQDEKQQLQEASSQQSQSLFSSLSSLREVFRIILHHHEWFDGSGHPAGLKGGQIPLESRILCVAEAYDALISPRPHREPLTHHDARQVVEKESGTHFDPDVVTQFLKMVAADEETAEAGEEEDEEVREELLSKERQVELMLGLANTYLSAGDLETASKAYSESLELLPESSGGLRSEALVGLALSNFHRVRIDEARKFADRAVEAAVGQSQLRMGRGLAVRGLLRGMQGEEPALEDLDKAKEIFTAWEAQPELATSALYRARVHKKRGDENHARQHLEQASEIIEKYGLQQMLRQHRHLVIPLLLEFAASATPAAERMLQSLGFEAVQPFLADVNSGVREKVMELLSPKEGATGAVQAPPLSLYGFGKFRVFAGGQEVGDKLWKTRKSKYLFAYLAVHSGRDIPDEKIMDLFWTDHPPEKARQSLYAGLSHMRKALEAVFAGESERVVLARKGFYRFNVDRPWFFDVAEFERQYELGQVRSREGREDDSIIAFQKAESLYQGEFMEGYYSDWAIMMREELEMKYTEVLEALMEYFFRKGRYEVSNDYAQRLLKIDNCHQEAHLCLMKAFVAQGKNEQAARQYQSCSQIMKNELNISPSAEMSELFLTLQR
ncbi:MAG: HD domain-containing phosphohydrolase [Candidatus Eremiobacterota bacterium]